jgi:hypothetical protein
MKTTEAWQPDGFRTVADAGGEDPPRRAVDGVRLDRDVLVAVVERDGRARSTPTAV